MSHLLREHAPITEAGWGLLDEEAPAGVGDGSDLAQKMVHSGTPFKPPMPRDPDVSIGPGG